MSSLDTAFSKRSQARSSFSIILVGILGGSWDEEGAVDLDRGALDGVVSTGMDESTSNTWTGGWDEGRVGLITWDDLCLAFFPRWLGRFPRSRFFDNDFLLSPVDRQA